jgi:ubiquinone/menaquinone biosynthesis C-methylase UbiE
VTVYYYRAYAVKPRGSGLTRGHPFTYFHQVSDAFKDFEHAGWENVVAEYDHAFGALTTQAIEPLLDAVEAGRGVRLLDVACGPGYVAATAAKRGVEVVGLDFSAPMVAEAKRRHPAVEFREGDAETLPFPEKSFDAVVMNFGILHLGRPDLALHEACRVLRPGGKFAFTVWAKPVETAGFGITLGAIQTHGDLNAPLPEGPPFFRFSDWDECVRSLRQAGFADPHIKKISQTWRLPSADALFEVMQTATVRTAGLLRRQSPQALNGIRGMMANASRLYEKNSVFEFPMPAILASAVKPKD